MTFDKYWLIGRLTLGFGVSTELWHTTRKNDSKVVNFIHFGYVPDVLPDKKCTSTLLVLTIMWLTMKIGIMRIRHETDDISQE
ncbi:TPA: hypothetical protein RCG95_000072 [Enterobacter roggenkampii]|nr:hypothetical protein [Enterobacter roggenkampii]